jgi:hypothetical protein
MSPKAHQKELGGPFKSYDPAIRDSIMQRWRTLLEQHNISQYTNGKVVLQLRLHEDGTVTDVHVTENSVGEVPGILCQKAVLDLTPFPSWPIDMRRVIGARYREIQFTFYYSR